MTALTGERHRRALAVGGAEVVAPADAEWEPRSSYVTNPSGNLISLFQGCRSEPDE
jgi:hypothetical protein